MSANVCTGTRPKENKLKIVKQNFGSSCHEKTCYKPQNVKRIQKEIDENTEGENINLCINDEIYEADVEAESIEHISRLGTADSEALDMVSQNI